MTATLRLALLAVLCGLAALPPGYVRAAADTAALPTPTDRPEDVPSEAEDHIYPAGRSPRVHGPSRTRAAAGALTPEPTATAQPPRDRGQAGPISLPVRRHVWLCVWRE